MFTPIPADIRNRRIGTIYCNLTDTYCFHEIKSIKVHNCIALDDYTSFKCVLCFFIP